MNIQVSKIIYVVIVLALAAAFIVMLILFLTEKRKTKETEGMKLFRELESYMTPAIKTPKLEKGGVVRVYVSAGMFDIAATLYAVGPDGMKPGLSYQSITLIDMICNFSKAQWTELEALCKWNDVPWYGITGEIEKMGWQCYCPIRDGFSSMAIISRSIASATYHEITKAYDASEAGVWGWSNSIFNPKNLVPLTKKAYNIKGTPTQDDQVAYAKMRMNGALGSAVGAEDLYAMYAACNTCIFNFNGLQGDAGALAEVGQLGARGVPTVIIKGSVTADFAGASNPMPVMATTSAYTLISHLTTNKDNYFYDNVYTREGALNWLQAKVNRFIEAEASNNPDPLVNGSYNNLMPLPPLQIFWTTLGSKTYFLKHKSKAVATLPNGKCDFAKDYTQFWTKNVVEGGTKGFIQTAKALADSLNELFEDPKFKNINKYWA
jgi:hypothetical protein